MHALTWFLDETHPAPCLPRRFAALFSLSLRDREQEASTESANPLPRGGADVVSFPSLAGHSCSPLPQWVG